MAGTYKIVCKPEGKYADRKDDEGEDENRSAMIVALVDEGATKQEVCRVGFVRRNTKHPDVSFQDQLTESLGTARAAAQILNEQLAGDGDLL